MQERLQKILSARGIASRRKAEEYILAGLVRVNGEVALLGSKADPDTDVIDVDGQILDARREMKYFVLNKPVGVVTSNVDKDARKGGKASADDAEAMQGFEITQTALKRLQKRAKEDTVPTVRELLPTELQGLLFPVGRLDKDSSGLLLMTNDGVLAYRLTHPKFYHEKEYEVETAEPIPESSLKRLKDGVMIDGSPTKPVRIKRLGDRLFRICLTEGRYRQIRRMCQKVGSTVTSLTRIRITSLTDTRLRPGELRELTAAEVDALKKSVEMEH
jgi:23S rRNA pseudouridine2605 synthase